MTPRTLLRTTLTVGLTVLALTTAARAQHLFDPPEHTQCKLETVNIRSYASDVDPYHYKRVVVYCDAGEQALSCEANTFVSKEYKDDPRYKYFLALSALYQVFDPKTQRYGCEARANTVYANYDGYQGESTGDFALGDAFFWGLKAYASCVPVDCVDHAKGEGKYTYFAHEAPTDPAAPIDPDVPTLE
jgi:hypothetical protein